MLAKYEILKDNDYKTRVIEKGDNRFMNENLENELKQWEEDYKKESEKILKEHPLEENILSNNHPINKLDRKYWKKKEELYKKYNTIGISHKKIDTLRKYL